jgi:hypothetical protein
MVIYDDARFPNKKLCSEKCWTLTNLNEQLFWWNIFTRISVEIVQDWSFSVRGAVNLQIHVLWSIYGILNLTVKSNQIVKQIVNLSCKVWYMLKSQLDIKFVLFFSSRNRIFFIDSKDFQNGKRS